MKKKLIILALSMLVGTTGVSLAANNPFADVPKDHWAYKAVYDLQKAGLIEGFDDGTYKGSQTMSRYKMAQFVAKVMTRLDQADAANRAKIEKLQAEFSDELKKLGVKVDNLKAEVDRMPKFSGEVRMLYQNIGEGNDTACDGFTAGTYFTERTRLGLMGNINDMWSYHGRFENTQDLRGNSDSNHVDYNLAWLEGKSGSNVLKLGRFEYKPVYGLVADSSMKGIGLTGGNKVTYGLYYGKPELVPMICDLRNNWFFKDPAIIAGELGTKIGSNVNVRAGMYNVSHTYNNTPDRHFNIYEVGADARFGDFNVTTAYAQSDIPKDEYDEMGGRKKSYIIGLNYKGADPNKPQSFGLDASYQANGRLVSLDSTLDVANGYKGYKYGANYTLDKNVVLKTSYINAKGIAHPGDVYKTYKGEVYFYF